MGRHFAGVRRVLYRNWTRSVLTSKRLQTIRPARLSKSVTRVFPQVAGSVFLQPWSPELAALRQEIATLRQEIGVQRQEIGVQRQEIGVQRRELAPLRQEIVALAQIIMPTASVVALKAGLTTLSLAHMLILLAPNAALYSKTVHLLTMLNHAPQSALLSPPPSSSMTALQLASEMLCPTQKPLYMAKHHRQPFLYLSRILMRNFKEDGKKAVQALAMTHTGGLVVHEMTVDTFVKTARLYIELETGAKQKLTRDWELLLWLWTKVTGHPDLSSKGMAKTLLNTKIYHVSDPEN